MLRLSLSRPSLPLLILLGLAVFSHAVAAGVPRGVFSLSITNVKAKEKALNNPDVTGIAVRQDWAELEPAEGEFAWEFLDSEVARAYAVGKQVLLRINTQAGKPVWVTQAVAAAGGTFFTFDDNGVETTIPVFWDPTFLAKKKAMLTALGDHFANSPVVTIISVSFANATSEDWNVPHLEEEVNQWLTLGYTSEKMLDAARQIMDTAMVAFPNQYLTLAVGGSGHSEDRANLDPTATYVASNAVANAEQSWPGRLIVQINSLSTFNPPAPGFEDSAWNLLWNSRPEVGSQMLYNVFEDDDYRVNDGMPGDYSEILANAVDHGVSYEVNYIEIYQKDVENLPAIIAYARSKMEPTPTPIPTPTPTSTPTPTPKPTPTLTPSPSPTPSTTPTPGPDPTPSPFPTPTPTPVELGNLSTRLAVGRGDNVLIGGFIIAGPLPKKVILRAIGPSLGMVEALGNPSLELYDGSGEILAANDDWKKTDSAQRMEILASGIAPPEERESALVRSLDPGFYTAVVRGAGDTTGIALVECYDLDPTNGSRLVNISTRGRVETRDGVMIGGMIILGDAPARVILRALGPSLPVADALADPSLELHNAEGAIIAANDNWRSDHEAEIMASTIQPKDDAESAIITFLKPGAYTAIVRGSAGQSGVGLVECYQLE